MAFGAKIKLSVDNNSEEFRKQIQSAVDAASKNVTLKSINISKDLTKNLSSAFESAISSAIQNQLNGLGSKVNDAVSKSTKSASSNNSNGAGAQMRRMMQQLGIRQVKDSLNNDVTSRVGYKLNDASLSGYEKYLKSLNLQVKSVSQSFSSNNDVLRYTVTAYDNATKSTVRFTDSIDRASKKIISTKGDMTSSFSEMDKAAQKTAEQAKQIKNISETRKSLTKELDSLRAAFNDNGGYSNNSLLNVGNGIERADKLLQIIDSESATIKQKQNALNSLSKIIDRQNTNVSNYLRRQSNNNDSLMSTKSINNLITNMEKYKSNNFRVYNANKDQFDSWIQTLSSPSGVNKETFKSIEDAYSNVTRAAVQAGIEGTSAIQKLKAGWQKFGGWSIVTMSMTKGIQAVRQMVSAVKELDTAMTELKKVTDYSSDTYANYMSEAGQIAKQTGSTVSEVINATADFARLGDYSIEESSSMAQSALIYKNIGDGIESIDDATNSIVSTMKAFGIQTEDTLSIVDKFNEVGNRFSISSGGIGTALQKSASALAAGNNTLEESMAMITGANEIVQNPEIVGTSIKTISMYLRAAKAEAEDAGEETEGMANSVSDLRDKILALTNSDVDIMLDDKTFKSTAEILREISSVWNDIADVDQAALLQLIGGKRNANITSALITNWSQVEKAIQVASDAEGSATRENEKYLDSIEGKTAKFQASFQSFSDSIVSSDFMKTLIDSGTTLLNILEGIVDNFGSLAAIAGTVGGVLSGKMNIGLLKKYTDEEGNEKVGWFTKANRQTQINNDNAVYGNISRMIMSSELDNLTYDSPKYIAAMRDIEIESKKFGATTKEAFNNSFNAYTFSNIDEARERLNSFYSTMEETSNKVSRLGNGGLKNALQGIGSSLKNFGKNLAMSLANSGIWALATMAISSVVNGITDQINAARNRVEESTTKTQDTSSKISTIADYRSQVESLYKELNSGNLSESEAYNIRVQLAQIQSEVIKNFGEEAAGLNTITSSANAANAALSNLSNVEMQQNLADTAQARKEAYDFVYGSYSSGLFGSDMTTVKNDLEHTALLNWGAVLLGDKDSQYSGWYSRKTEEDADKLIQDLQTIAKDAGVILSTEKDQSDARKFYYKYTMAEGTSRYDFSEALKKLQEGITNYSQAKGIDMSQMLGQISDTKSYWFDDNYTNQYDNLKTWGEYIVATQSKWKSIGDSLTEIKTDIDTSISDKDYERVQSSIDDLNSVKESIEKNAISTSDDRVANLYLQSIIESIENEIAQEQLMLKFKSADLSFENIDSASLQRTLNQLASNVAENMKNIDADNLELDNIYNNTLNDYEKEQFNILQQAASQAKVSVSEFITIAQQFGYGVNAVTYATKSLSDAASDASSFAESVSKTKDVLDAQNAGTTISYDKLLGDDYQEALENVNGELQYNAEKLAEINELKAKQLIAENDLQKKNIQKTYLQNAKKIDSYRKQINQLITSYRNEGVATKGARDSLADEIQWRSKEIIKLEEQNASIAKQCDQYDILNANIRGTIGVYKAWLDAQNTAESGDMFDDALSAMQAIRDVADSTSDAFGKVGTKKYKAAVDFIIPSDVDKEDVDAVQSYLDSIAEYFTYDENGNYSGLDLHDLLWGANSAGLMTTDDGETFTLLGGMTMEKFAEGMHLSLPMVKAIFGELQEYGAQFEWIDLSASAIKANEALDSLKSRADELTGLKFDINGINLDLTSFDTAEEKLKAVNTHISMMKEVVKANIDTSSVDDAIEVLKYLSYQKAELEYPALITTQFDYDQMTAEAASMVEQLQIFVESKGKVDIGTELGIDIDGAQLEMETAFNTLQNSEYTEILASLGIDVSSYESLTTTLKQIEESNPEIWSSLLISEQEANSEIEKWKNIIQKALNGIKITISINGNTMTLKADVDDTKKNIESNPATVTVNGNSTLFERTANWVQSLKDSLASTTTVGIGTSQIEHASSWVSELTNRIWAIPNRQVRVDVMTSVGGVVGNVLATAFGGLYGYAQGTAHANGTASGIAYAGGRWGVTTPGKALVGELGREIIVRGDKWFTVGDNGAMFTDLQRGDIVFNHKQSEALLERGFVFDRGTVALAGGTAYSQGTALATGVSGSIVLNTYSKQVGGGTVANTGSNNSEYYSDAGATEEALDTFEDWFSTLFDWIEVKLERQTDRISAYVAEAETAVNKGLSLKNSVDAINSYTDAIKALQVQVTYQNQASSSYASFAESILQKAISEGSITSGTAEMIRRNVADGAISIDSYDDATRTVIESYKEYMDKAHESAVAMSELNSQIASYTNTMIQIPIDRTQKSIDMLNSVLSNYESSASLKSALGMDLSSSDYQNRISAIEQEVTATKELADTYQNLYSQALNNADGTQSYGGKSADEWNQLYNSTISDMNKLKIEIETIKDDLRDDIYWKAFERAEKAAARFRSVLDGISSLLNDNMLYGSNGKLNEFGKLQLANTTKQLTNARDQVSLFGKEIANLNSLYNAGYYTADEYNEKLADFRDNLLSAASTAQSSIQSIIDILKEEAQKELDAINEVIDARTEALDKKKSYYEYDKTLKSQNKEIKSLKAQIAALNGVTDAASKAKKAKLEEQLATAEEDMNDTVQNHYFDLASSAYTELKDTLQTSFNDYWDNIWTNFDNIDELLEKANQITASSSSEITKALKRLLGYYGISESDIGIDESYASGTKYVPRDMNALTNESGNEIIVTKHGLITPLKQGDGVIPANLTSRLYELAVDGVTNRDLLSGNASLPNATISSNVSIVNNYDNLINITGSADAATVADLKKFSTEFLQKSYEYTSKKIYDGYRKAGGKRKA